MREKRKLARVTPVPPTYSGNGSVPTTMMVTRFCLIMLKFMSKKAV